MVPAQTGEPSAEQRALVLGDARRIPRPARLVELPVPLGRWSELPEGLTTGAAVQGRLGAQPPPQEGQKLGLRQMGHGEVQFQALRHPPVPLTEDHHAKGCVWGHAVRLEVAVGKVKSSTGAVQGRGTAHGQA